MTRIVISVILVALTAGMVFIVLRPTSPSVQSRHRIAAKHKPYQLEIEDATADIAFRIDWPPKEPTDSKSANAQPLLGGSLVVTSGKDGDTRMLNIRILIDRPSSNEDRLRWNQKLQFPEYDWMSRVRVWDYEKKWLWPNLPFLLRAHGLERQERYGGIDPGKGIDNDFAAVVVRPVKSSGDVLVTAEWNAPPVGWIDKRSIVHQAISDDLQWPTPDGVNEGKLGVWIVYADFLEYRARRSWPEEPEYDGGILAFFSIDWRIEGTQVVIDNLANEIPPSATGVDWKKWQQQFVTLESLSND